MELDLVKKLNIVDEVNVAGIRGFMTHLYWESCKRVSTRFHEKVSIGDWLRDKRIGYEISARVR